MSSSSKTINKSDYLSELISTTSYVAETAQDGEEALEKLGATPVDVIVTDLMMPGVDGFKLLRTLLDRGDLTPAVVLTGLGRMDQAVSIVHDLRAFWFLRETGAAWAVATLLERAVQHTSLVKEWRQVDGSTRRTVKLSGLYHPVQSQLPEKQ